MSYLDDMNIVGAFRRLCVDDDGVRSIGLEPCIPKCGIYGGDKELAATEAAKHRITHHINRFTTVGTPLGSAKYASNALGRRAATAETLVEPLLSIQSQFLPLHASLQVRIVHLMRMVPCEVLAAHIRRTDAAVWRGAAAVHDFPPGLGVYGADMEGPYKACSTLGW